MYCILCLILFMAVGGNTDMNENKTSYGITSHQSPTPTNEFAFATNDSNMESSGLSQTFIGSTQPQPTGPISQQGNQIDITAQPANNKCGFFILCNMDQKMSLLVMAALSVACIVLLLSTLILACKLCRLKKSMVVTAQFTKRRESVDCETGPMMNETSKQEEEEDGNQSGTEGPEEPEEPEEPEKQKEEAAEDTEVNNQASTEDSTQCVTPAAEEPPNQENGMSGQIIQDAAEE